MFGDASFFCGRRSLYMLNSIWDMQPVAIFQCYVSTFYTTYKFLTVACFIARKILALSQEEFIALFQDFFGGKVVRRKSWNISLPENEDCFSCDVISNEVGSLYSSNSSHSSDSPIHKERKVNTNPTGKMKCLMSHAQTTETACGEREKNNPFHSNIPLNLKWY